MAGLLGLERGASAAVLPFWSSAMNSFALTVATELGDKTFLMGVVLAMQNPRALVLIGAILAMSLQTILSSVAGKVLPGLIDPWYMTAAAVVMFEVFGLQMFLQWYRMRGKAEPSDEFAKTESELSEDVAAGRRLEGAAVVLRTFMLIFLAEWGDRSQLTTVVLAASRNTYGIAAGGILGQAACMTLAVVGGKYLATIISERMMSLLGGLVFTVTGAIIGASLRS